MMYNQGQFQLDGGDSQSTPSVNAKANEMTSSSDMSNSSNDRGGGRTFVVPPVRMGDANNDRGGGRTMYTPSPSTLPTGGSAYTIQRGDTLSGIAAKNNTTLSALKAANPEFTSNPKYQGGNMIFSGGKVNLPSGSSGSVASPGRGRTVNTPAPATSHTSGQPSVGGSFMQTPNYNSGSKPVAPAAPKAAPSASPAPLFGGLPSIGGFPSFGGAAKPSVPGNVPSRGPSQFVPGISKLPSAPTPIASASPKPTATTAPKPIASASPKPTTTPFNGTLPPAGSWLPSIAGVPSSKLSK
jgi:LysM domain